MAVYIPLGPLPFQFQDTVTSVNMTSGTIEFYLAGTSTPTNLFSDNAGTSIGTSITLNSGGMPESGGNVITLFRDADVDLKLVLKNAAGSEISTADNLLSPSQWLTSSQVGQIVHPQTTAESNAGITPTDYSYLEGHLKRYGVAGDDSTDDTSDLADAFSVGYQGVRIHGDAGMIVLTDTFTMSDGNSNVPPVVDFRGITLKANAGQTGALVTIENPHTAYEQFRWDGPTIFDANSTCSSGLLIHGSQRCVYDNLIAINASGGPQIRVEAESGFGVFYNEFRSFIGGRTQSEGGDDDGISIKTTDGTNRIAANVWTKPTSNWNEGAGLDIDHCSDTFYGLSAEKNDGNAVDIDNCPAIAFVGGYTENNHLGMSGGGASDMTTDTSFVTTANSNRVMIFGGNHIGVIDDSAIGSEPMLITRESAGISITSEGLSFGGESLFDNYVNFADEDGGLRFNGVNALLFDQSDDEFDWHKNQRLTGNMVINATAGFLQLPTATTTELEDISGAINTEAGKVEGAVVFNTTTNQPVYAAGNTDGDVWVDATGSTAHTPA